MSGNQSRGLIQASRTRGWDPTVIPARDGEPENRTILPNFDKDQGNLPGKRVGDLPGGTPDGWPDGYDSQHPQLKVAPGTKDFAIPDVSREVAKHTNGADPYPGFGGEGY